MAFTSENRVRDVIRNFNADGFGSLYPRYKGGRSPKFTLEQRREIKKIASPGSKAHASAHPAFTPRNYFRTFEMAGIVCSTPRDSLPHLMCG